VIRRALRLRLQRFRGEPVRSVAEANPLWQKRPGFPGERRLKTSRDRRGNHRAEPSGSAAAQASREPARPPERPLARREARLPDERLPLILEVAPNEDYALLDSGGGEKLEQYGPYRIVRPEGQAIWQKALPAR
jgi:23S rRNA (cytosine1962-C5)-methyltransferase